MKTGKEIVGGIFPGLLGAIRQRAKIRKQIEDENVGGGVCRECGSALVLDVETSVQRRIEAGGKAEVVAYPCRECVAREQLRQLGVPEQYVSLTFRNFRCETDEDRKALKLATEYATTPEDRWFILSGDIGRGKTHLATAIFRVVRFVNARWIDQPDAITELRQSRERWADGSFTARLQDTKLLLWDDFGIGAGAKDEGALIESVFHRRTANRLPTIITTNMPGKAFGQALGPRLADRVREKIFAWVSLSGESRRVRHPITGDESR